MMRVTSVTSVTSVEDRSGGCGWVRVVVGSRGWGGKVHSARRSGTKVYCAGILCCKTDRVVRGWCRWLHRLWKRCLDHVFDLCIEGSHDAHHVFDGLHAEFFLRCGRQT